jgi:Holliday junction DNA helicase RuvA
MIAFIKGRIRLVKDDFMVVESHGIGYKIYVPTSLIEECHKMSGKIALHIHHHQTERSNELYGFKTYLDLEMFELLLTVGSIGPKAAATLLSTFKGSELKTLIVYQDEATLATAKGIGIRAAGKICRELGEKIEDKDEYENMRPHASTPSREALQALIQLGYNQIEAQAALRMIPRGITDPKEKVKEALRNLGR